MRGRWPTHTLNYVWAATDAKRIFKKQIKFLCASVLHRLSSKLSLREFCVCLADDIRVHSWPTQIFDS